MLELALPAASLGLGLARGWRRAPRREPPGRGFLASTGLLGLGWALYRAGAESPRELDIVALQGLAALCYGTYRFGVGAGALAGRPAIPELAADLAASAWEACRGAAQALRAAAAAAGWGGAGPAPVGGRGVAHLLGGPPAALRLLRFSWGSPRPQTFGDLRRWAGLFGAPLRFEVRGAFVSPDSREAPRGFRAALDLGRGTVALAEGGEESPGPPLATRFGAAGPLEILGRLWKPARPSGGHISGRLARVRSHLARGAGAAPPPPAPAPAPAPPAAEEGIPARWPARGDSPGPAGAPAPQASEGEALARLGNEFFLAITAGAGGGGRPGGPAGQTPQEPCGRPGRAPPG